VTGANELLARIKTKFPGLELAEVQRPTRLWLQTGPEVFMELCQYLKGMGFDTVSSISGVDRRTNLEVVYMLWSTTLKVVALVKVPLPKDSNNIPSVTGLWSAANWHERETAEMFGITFDGHPDPRHILLTDDTEFHPMLKSFKYDNKEGLE
jgi:NADH-quinone oxidoreductase subunit C